MGIREEERFWLEERRKRVRGNDKVTRPWGTTQIAWIYEISERASETKSWERLTPPAAAPILFAKDDGLRLCVDYEALNKSHGDKPISWPTDLGDARQDLRNAYHLIQIKEGDKYKTELQTN